MGSKFEQQDLSKIRSVPIAERQSKVHIGQFVDPDALDGPGGDALAGMLPEILKGADLKAVVGAVREARRRGRPIIWLLGAHVIKCGLSLYVNALVRRGFISAVATTGSATVHDLELSFFGKTSEDVGTELPRGRFGMAAETAEHFAAACGHAAECDMGLGEGLGDYIAKRSAHSKYSIFAAASRAGVPATVHVALGTDITHQHPEFPASLVGELSMRDFRVFTATVGELFDRGVIVVFGSAVVLPEVFLKAVSIGYNLGRKPRDTTAVSFDMFQQYRVRENILSRPFQDAGKSYAFNGHHEIMLPLLYHLLVNE